MDTRRATTGILIGTGGCGGGEVVNVTADDVSGLLVMAARTRGQIDAEQPKPGDDTETGTTCDGYGPEPETDEPAPERVLSRFHGTVELDPQRPGRDAGKIADEVIAHLTGIVGAKVRVSLEIEAEMPEGASENVVRIVTENASTLKFEAQGFEEE